MASPNKELIERLRTRIRAFEDKKISGAEIGREVFWTAREIHNEDEGQVRRKLETLGNRITSLAERGISEPVRDQILTVIEDLESELREWGL